MLLRSCFYLLVCITFIAFWLSKFKPDQFSLVVATIDRYIEISEIHCIEILSVRGASLEFRNFLFSNKPENTRCNTGCRQQVTLGQFSSMERDCTRFWANESSHLQKVLGVIHSQRTLRCRVFARNVFTRSSTEATILLLAFHKDRPDLPFARHFNLLPFEHLLSNVRCLTNGSLLASRGQRTNELLLTRRHPELSSKWRQIEPRDLATDTHRHEKTLAACSCRPGAKHHRR